MATLLKKDTTIVTALMPLLVGWNGIRGSATSIFLKFCCLVQVDDIADPVALIWYFTGSLSVASSLYALVLLAASIPLAPQPNEEPSNIYCTPLIELDTMNILLNWAFVITALVSQLIINKQGNAQRQVTDSAWATVAIAVAIVATASSGWCPTPCPTNHCLVLLNFLSAGCETATA